MSKKKKTNETAVRLKHKLLLNRMLGNVGKGKKLNFGKLMRELGYKDTYAKNPKNLLKTKDWNSLMEEYLPDKSLAEVHKKLLNKTEILGQPHSDVKGALDMAYKLKRKYGDLTIQHKFGELSDEELEGEIAEIISEALRLTEGKGQKDNE